MQGFASKMMKMWQVLGVPAVGVDEDWMKDPQAVVSWELGVWGEWASGGQRGQGQEGEACLEQPVVILWAGRTVADAAM